MTLTADRFADPFTAAQRAAEDHIGAVWEYHNEADEMDLDEAQEQLGDDPAYGPWCGCTTCEVREILHAAVPVLARAIAAGVITVDDLIPAEDPAELVGARS